MGQCELKEGTLSLSFAMTEQGEVVLDGGDDEESILIGSVPIRWQLSDADIAYRSTEPRILAREDLRLAEHVAAVSKERDVISPGSRRPSYIDIWHSRDRADSEPKPFTLNDGTGLTSQEAMELLSLHGKNMLPEKVKPKILIFLEQLYQPMSLMLWLAIIILAAIEQFLDMAILMFIMFANSSIAFYETTKSADAVAALKSNLQPLAVAKRNGEWKEICASEIVPGDLVKLSVGCACPADCRLHIGTEADSEGLQVDQSALTGESEPVTLYYNESVKMGTTVVKGESVATVEFTGAYTYFGKTATLLKAGPKGALSNMQRFIISVVVILTCVSVTMVVTALIWLLLGEGVPVVDALRFAVVLLVASIPLAIEIVVTTTLALGSKELSKHGAITTRLAAIEDMASCAILCCDKTGTLTTNRMVLMSDPGCPVYLEGFDQDLLLQYASLATNFNEPPRDALDSLVFKHVDLASLRTSYELLKCVPFDPVSKRSEGLIVEKSIHPANQAVSSGSTPRRLHQKRPHRFRVAKGAPHVILELCGGQRRPDYVPGGDDDEEDSAAADKTIAEASYRDLSALATLSQLELEHLIEDDVRHYGSRGIRCLAVATREDNDEGGEEGKEGGGGGVDDSVVSVPTKSSSSSSSSSKWGIVGLLTFLDPPRKDTKQTLREARSLGVHLKMVTGDHVLIAKEMARRLDMSADILLASSLPLLDPVTHAKPEHMKEQYGDLVAGADGFAQVYPEHKYLIVETLRELGYKVGMTGDGVNDAPALKTADVGIAVSGATDAACAAADIVLTQEGLSTIVRGIEISRCIFARIRNFVVYRVAATMQLLFFFFIAVFAFRPADYNPQWPVYFALPVLFIMLITLLNDGTMIAVAYDTTEASQTPCVWNLRVLFTVGGVLAAVACLSSLLLLWALLASGQDGSFFQSVGLGVLTYGQITASIYLKVSISDFLTLFSARTGEQWFWSNCPPWILLLAACGSLLVSTIIACAFPKTVFDDVQVEGLALTEPRTLFLWIWLYCLVWWLVQDAAKVGTYSILKRFNVFGYNDTGEMKVTSSVS
jgi:H+-transporting ATPase